MDPGPAFGPRPTAHRARWPANAVRPTATVAGGPSRGRARSRTERGQCARSSCGGAAGGDTSVSQVWQKQRGEHEGEVVSAPGNSLGEETH
jgi:hypothetical protein